MNICIATNSFFPDVGGIATYYNNLAGILTRQGHEVFVLMVDYNAQPGDEDAVIKDNEITKIILRNSYSRHYAFYSRYFSPGGFDAPQWIAMGIAMRNWLLHNQPTYQFDIIELSDYGGLGSFLIHPQLPPVAVTGHGSLLQYSTVNHTKKDSHYKLLVQFEKTAFEYADSILPYSPLNQQQLGKIFDRPVDFATAPWIPADFSTVSTSVKGLPLVIAGLQKIKGAEILPEALAILKEQGNDIAVEWIGADFFTAPPNGRSMALYLEERFPGLWDKNFLWRKEQPRDTTKQSLAESSYVVIPSLYETLSYVALEAATLGKALIITRGTGASYLFTHDHTAWVIAENNAAQLADAILHLNSDPLLREKLGKNAKEMIADIFDPAKLAAERMAIYDKIIRNRKQQSDIFTRQMSFINSYITAPRRLYFLLRKIAKKIINR